DKNNGVLLLVAPNERKVRIEVGYGLEGTLTDAISRFIIETAMVPRFRANDAPQGVVRGVDDIIDVLSGDAEEWKRRAAPPPKTSGDRALDVVSTVVGVLALLFFAGLFIFMGGFLLYLPASWIVKAAIWMGWLPARAKPVNQPVSKRGKGKKGKKVHIQ